MGAKGSTTQTGTGGSSDTGTIPSPKLGHVLISTVEVKATAQTPDTLDFSAAKGPTVEQIDAWISLRREELHSNAKSKGTMILPFWIRYHPVWTDKGIRNDIFSFVMTGPDFDAAYAVNGLVPYKQPIHTLPMKVDGKGNRIVYTKIMDEENKQKLKSIFASRPALVEGTVTVALHSVRITISECRQCGGRRCSCRTPELIHETFDGIVLCLMAFAVKEELNEELEPIKDESFIEIGRASCR